MFQDVQVSSENLLGEIGEDSNTLLTRYRLRFMLLYLGMLFSYRH